MLATLNILTNPFNPNLDRIQKPLRRKTKISTVVRQQKINLNKPVVCFYNGSPVLRADWERTYIKDRDVLTFMYLPRGGGGSNPLRFVLMIAAAIYAPLIAGQLLGATSGFAFQALSAGIGLLGNTLINALIPPPQPPKNQQQNALSSPSPTYSLSAQGNQARIGQPIPVLYGKMKMYPDFGAQPFAEYENNEQYLYQLFVISQGSVTLNPSDINIEDSPIASFGDDYELEVVLPNTASQLFPNEVFNVSEVAGQELETPVDMIGYFTANPPLTQVNKLAFDVVLPKGLCYINDEGAYEGRSIQFAFYAQRIDDAGLNIGGEITLGSPVISAASPTIIRRTYKYNVTPGRYKIAAKRISAKNFDPRTANDILWSTARSYVPGARIYGDITMLAMKLKATNSFSSQSSRRINLTATRQLPVPVLAGSVYNWSIPQETQSIAWAIADMCRAQYGAGASNARFNIAQLVALNAIWTARGDKLNCVFDSSQTFWEALSIACRAGRCRPYIQGGVINFVRDSLQTLPTALFTNRNIVKDSFKLSYVMSSEDNADCVDVEYFDEVIWKPRVVRAQLDAGSATKAAKIKAFGITNRQQAFKEGMYIAAANRYRRKEITFETELEGHIPSLGDLIGIQSDIPEWGQYGEVIASSPGSITSSEPFVWTNGVPHFAMFRKADGSGFGPIEVSRGASDNIITFSPSLLTIDVYSGHEKEKTHITFGRSGQVVQLARVLSTTPREKTVMISAISEDARVHSADGTPIPVDTYEWGLIGTTVRPILTDFSLTQSGSGATPSILTSWNPVAGASKYIVEKSFDNENWEGVGEISLNSISFLATPGTIYVRVAAFGGVLGPYVTKSINVGLIPPPANVMTGAISANGQSFEVSWSEVVDSDGYYVEVLNAGNLKRSFNTVSTFFAYSIENAITDGGPWRTITVKVYAVKGSIKSTTALTLNGTNAAPAAPTLTLSTGGTNVGVSISRCDDLDYAGTLIYASETSGFTPSPANLVFDGVGNFFLVETEAELFFRAAHYDTYGKTGLNFSAEFSATPNGNPSGITIVNSLPPTGAEGDVVYLTTDDLLYTHDGIAWRASGNVADGSITYEKLASGLNFLASIDAGEIQAYQIAANSITAEKISAGAIIASKISVANLAAISANMGSITAGNITLDNAGFIKGGQTNYNTGTGFFLGYHNTTYKFSLGNSTNGITWDGSDLNVAGNFVAGSINVNNKFLVAPNGNVTIKSADVGARLEITNDVIRVYDDNGVLRVKLGRLS